MLLHNNSWQITRTGTTYYLHAPNGEVMQLESKSPLYRTHRGGGAAPPKPPRVLPPPGQPLGLTG